MDGSETGELPQFMAIVHGERLVMPVEFSPIGQTQTVAQSLGLSPSWGDTRLKQQ